MCVRDVCVCVHLLLCACEPACVFLYIAQEEITHRMDIECQQFRT